MNGHFEVDNSSYPYGPLKLQNVTCGGYVVHDMPRLAPLHSHPISLEQAKRVCSEANAKRRSVEFTEEQILNFIQDEVKVS